MDNILETVGIEAGVDVATTLSLNKIKGPVSAMFFGPWQTCRNTSSYSRIENFD